jgi:hypothetical protein
MLLSWIELFILLALVVIVARVAAKSLSTPKRMDGYAKILRIQRHPYGVLKGNKK